LHPPLPPTLFPYTTLFRSATYKGFNDTLADWSSNRTINQNCGQTWLSTFSEIGKYYSKATQLESLQLVTWNDYEEATEIESGIRSEEHTSELQSPYDLVCR